MYFAAVYNTKTIHASTGRGTLCMPWNNKAEMAPEHTTDEVSCTVCRARLPYTAHDVDIAVREYKAIQANIDEYDGPAIAVFSFGYGEIWADGDVTAHKRVVFKVDESGEVS